MLTEKKSDWQDAREGRRRWFYDGYFHLVVWYAADQDLITGFELSYGSEGRRHAVVWHTGHAVSHFRVDDGERPGLPRMSPVLVAGGTLDTDEVVRRFRIASKGTDPSVRSIVIEKLLEHQRQSVGDGALRS